jgi:hypothetical protein
LHGTDEKSSTIANRGTIRDLLENSPEAHEYVEEKNRLNLGETKFLPQNMQFSVDIMVYNQTVAMISPKNIIAVLIEDAAIAASQRQLLEFIWNIEDAQIIPKF